MSRYELEPIDFAALKTVPLRGRGGKVSTADFAQPHRPGTGLAGWLDSLPRLLAADGFRALVAALAAAREKQKPVIWGMGGHVIKCGLAPVLLDLMRRGYATAFAMNGSAAIHDFEIALVGYTSEDVEAVLPDGRFGAAEETGGEMNKAIVCGAREGIGMGEALGRRASEIHGQFANSGSDADPRASASGWSPSLLVEAWRARVPVTVHVAVGTDTPHTHPAAEGAAIGAATHHDFRLFCRLVSQLDGGGVYVNAGSAVLLPEVFLKAVSSVRNLGFPLDDFTTVNLDFLQHYRPRVNVLERPHARSSGRGIGITGHHELMIPLLAAVLAEREG